MRRKSGSQENRTAGAADKNQLWPCAGRLTAEVKLLVRVIATVVVSVALPMRLDADVVLALKQEGGAVCAIGKTGGWK